MPPGQSRTSLELLPTEIRLMIFSNLVQSWITQRCAENPALFLESAVDRRIRKAPKQSLLDVAAVSPLLATDITSVVTRAYHIERQHFITQASHYAKIVSPFLDEEAELTDIIKGNKRSSEIGDILIDIRGRCIRCVRYLRSFKDTRGSVHEETINEQAWATAGQNQVCSNLELLIADLKLVELRHRRTEWQNEIAIRVGSDF